MNNLDIDSFIELLGTSELNSIELSEILWLAKYLKTKNTLYKPQKELEKNIEEPKDNHKKSTVQKETKTQEDKKPEKITIKEKITNQTIPLMANKDKRNYNTLNIHYKSYFRDIQKLPEYLHTFKEKKESRKKNIFHQDKTVEYIAKTDIIMPIFQAKKEKRYTLYIFIDYGKSMQVWQDMCEVYQKIIGNSGIFKSIKVIYMNSNEKESSFYRDKQKKYSFNYRELDNCRQDKLIFILTDMRSTSWQGGNVLSILKKLYKSIPLFIIQVLPYRLWRTTTLRKSTITTLHTEKKYPTKDSYSSNIDYLLESIDDLDSSSILKLPLVNFDLSHLKTVGEVLSAKKGNRIDGAIFDLNDKTQQKRKKTNPLSQQERVNRFFANSSPKAQQLLISLSAVPLNLPIMKMIQEKILGEQSNIYIAEILNSNFISQKDELFEFDSPKIRNILLGYLGREKAFDILYKNSEYIEESLGTKNFSFKALLADNINLEEVEFDTNDRVFASISCQVLMQLGHEYAKKAGCFKNRVEIETIIPKSKKFMMGSEEYDREQPVHEVIIDYDFEIGKYPITVEEFRAFVEDSKYKTDAEKLGGAFVWDNQNRKNIYWDNPSFEQTENSPIVCVSWDDSIRYIEWLNRKTNSDYRLPTEEEWEFSCRADTKTRWHFGDNELEINNYSWHKNEGKNRTYPVGQKEPNNFGLYDMHGNVMEWCLDDWKDNYYNKSQKDSRYKVLRGGSWSHTPRYSRSAHRAKYPIATYDRAIGFRVVQTVSKKNDKDEYFNNFKKPIMIRILNSLS